MAIERNQNVLKRRLMIGGNVLLAMVVVWALIVVVNFIAAKTAPPAIDCTYQGQFTLSSRTEKLVAPLEVPVRLTALYRVSEEQDPAQREQSRSQRQRVEDLLARYASLSGKVTTASIDPIKDVAGKTALLDRLKKTFANESTKHAAVIAAFEEQSASLMKLVEGERNALVELLEKNPVFGKDKQQEPYFQNIVAAYYRFEKDLQAIKDVDAEVRELMTGSDIPRYSDSAKLVQKVVENVKADLAQIGEYMLNDGAGIVGLDEPTRTWFHGAMDRYRATIDAMNAIQKDASALPVLSLEMIYDQVKPKNAKVIVVEANGKAKVLAFDDVWKIARDSGTDPRVTNYDFIGESAVSSAILALTANERSAAIFVHCGPPDPIKPGMAMMRMTDPPYGAVKEKLEEANFIVESWDMAASPTEPVIEGAKERVYIVMPTLPKQPNPMQPDAGGGYSPEQVATLRTMLANGARMMFLANYSIVPAQAYPFAEMLSADFGVKVDSSKIVIRSYDVGDRKQPVPQASVTQYGSHAITDPIQSLNSFFFLAVPVACEATLPEHVTAWPLVTLDGTMPDFWAESNIFLLAQRGWAELDAEDTTVPFDLAVAAENTKTGARVVVFGNDMFASNEVANQVEWTLTGRGLVGMAKYPGNLELVANSAFWLNNNTNLIAVSPQKSNVVRVANISSAGMMAWKVMLYVVWPMLALVLGGVVYLARRA